MKTTDTNKNIWLDKATAPNIKKWCCKYDSPAMRIRSANVYRFYRKQEGASICITG